MTGGQGSQGRGEVDWWAEVDTWTMSGDRRSGEITDLSSTGGNRNNSALNDCLHLMFALNKYVYLNCTIVRIELSYNWIRWWNSNAFILSGGNSSWALKANTVVYSNYLTDIDASVSKCANSFSVTKQIIMTSGGMKKYRTQRSFIPQPCHYRVSVPRKSRQKLEQRADVSQCRN